MNSLKHIGRLRKNKRRAIVAYRTIPDAPTYALVVLTESLPADEHDSLIKLVESASGQLAHELADAMYRTVMPDGRNMLAALHATGQLRKVATNEIEMTPDTYTTIGLDELNDIIAQQKGVALEDLAVKPVITEEVRQDAEKKRIIAEQELAATIATTSDDPIVQAMNLAVAAKSTEEVSEVIPAVLAEVAPLTNAELAAQLRGHADAMFKEAQLLRKQAQELSSEPVVTKPVVTKPVAVKRVAVAKKSTAKNTSRA
jgi:hypothetical protein